jgi:hypothetical protein
MWVNDDAASCIQRAHLTGALRIYTKDGNNMASSGKRKTTMAKRARENKLRERRVSKQAKKEARRQAPSEHLDAPDGALDALTADAAELAAEPDALQPGVPPLAELD